MVPPRVTQKCPLCPLNPWPFWLQGQKRRNAPSRPVRAAPGAWRRPGRRQAPCPAGRTAQGAGGRRWGARRAGRAYGGVSAGGAGGCDFLQPHKPPLVRDGVPF